MKNSIWLSLVGFAAMAVVPLQATTTSFDFTQCSNSSIGQVENSACGTSSYSNTSNSFSQTVSGITVTATAYATAAGASGSAGTALSSGNSATVGQYTGNGLGVCSSGESGSPDYNNYNSSNPTGCNSPYHQVNDGGDYEFILFTFSTPVSLGSITLANFGGGSLSSMDLSYWDNPSSLLTIPAAATNVLCGQNGAATCPTVEGNGGGIGVGSLTDSLSGPNVTTLLVGAYTGGTSSFFKIQGLTVGPVTATPEPATFGMIGFALASLSLVARKRKAS